jgi:peptide/nickel transport system substrate-binding protein
MDFFRKLILLCGRFLELLKLERLRASFKLLKRREKILFWFFVLLLVFGVFWQATDFYFKNTKETPAPGGVYEEGVVGSPRLVNPVLGDTGEPDRVLETLLFAGLFKPDYQGGVIHDLAESFVVSEDRKSYTITLKDNLFWHDGRNLTADDVVYTIELIKNPEIRNPLATNWQGVNVEKISEKTIKFTIPSPYNSFVNNLTFGILPKHLWGQILPQNFLLAELNLKPIGAGPYRFKNVQKDKAGIITQYTLVANRKYPGPGPYLDAVVIRFFPTYDEAILALKKKDIDGLAGIPPEDAKSLASSQSLKLLGPVMPRYFALFLNNDFLLFKDVKIREALAVSVDKEKIIAGVLGGQAKEVSSPILPGMLGAKGTVRFYDPEKAKLILSQAGWRDSNNDGTLEKKLSPKDKTPTEFEFEILLPDSANLERVAQEIRGDLEKVGIRANLKRVSTSEFTSLLQQRSYRAVLFGQVLPGGNDPDPFAFWHSSQKTAPGLNLALYSNSKVDVFLEKIRREPSKDARKSMLEDFQDILQKDFPAIFLYMPEYTYAINVVLHLPEMNFLAAPTERLSRLNEWYLNTKRVWK